MGGPTKDIHFEISERKVLLRLMDLGMVLLGLCVLEYGFGFGYLTIDQEHTVPLVVLGLYIMVFGTVFEIYDLHKSSKLDTTFRNVVLTASTVVLFYLLTPFITPFLPEKRLQIVYFYVALIVGIFLWRVAYTTFVSSPRFNKKVLLVGEISNMENIVRPLKDSDPNYRIIGFINCEAEAEAPVKFKGLKEYRSEELIPVIIEERVSEVLVASFNAETIMPEIYHDLMMLLERGFTIREYTQVYEEVTHRVPIQFIGKDFYKYFPFSRSNQNALYLFFHRSFDMVFASLGLLIGVCFLPFVLLGNALGNRGPLFYKQERVGKNGVPFHIVKLRSMVVDAERNCGAKWAVKNDSRITKFGRFLRRSRIDEFPQFYNVLKGDMSIIGPRPERPYFVNELSQVIPFYETRHVIRPGLTGWAQINYRYGATIDDSLTKLQYDLYYIKHRSFFLDLNIILKTLSTIVYYRGQ
ncbi:sugar transferase [Mangrovimonas sp. TPBH4]|uniref:sugar transferase n=1 Tax=Mangrovimonas sp. TPBH4 TaxID=1645914 RepID=UPI0006B637B3|nr:sugar transferase [Mangrovimonas sp. TPBH4]